MIGKLPPPYCRQGNKYTIRHKIIPMIPAHETYVELFAGSGAIFFNKQKAKNNVLNDLDKNTTKSFNLIIDAPLDISTYPNPQSVEETKTFYLQPTENIIQNEIIRYKIIVSCGFCNKPVVKANRIYKNRKYHRWLKDLEKWKDKLNDTTIMGVDYEEAIRKYDGVDTFFFIDPPYENTVSEFGYAESKAFDFNRLLKALMGIKGKFLMTINDSTTTRQLFKDFIINDIDVFCSWNKSIRKELIITNYPITV